jgi:hypothetical protein
LYNNIDSSKYFGDGPSTRSQRERGDEGEKESLEHIGQGESCGKYISLSFNSINEGMVWVEVTFVYEGKNILQLPFPKEILDLTNFISSSLSPSHDNQIASPTLSPSPLSPSPSTKSKNLSLLVEQMMMEYEKKGYDR